MVWMDIYYMHEFYMHNAMLAQVLAMAMCPSVSVTSWSSVETAERIGVVLAWELPPPILHWTRSVFDNGECHVMAFRPVSEAAHSWSYNSR